MRRSLILFSIATLVACTGTKEPVVPTGSTGTGVPTTETSTSTTTGTTSTTYVSPTAPVASDDFFQVTEGGQVNGTPLDNDADPYGLALDLATFTIVTDPAAGTLQVAPNGQVRYVHDGSEDPVDTFEYTIANENGEVSNVATVTVSVDPVNDPPVAVADAANATEGAVTNINLAVNDSDVDDGLDLGSIQINPYPLHGTVAVNFNGTIDYTHDGSEDAADLFGYRIFDNSGAPSNSVNVTLTILGVNDPPTANDDLGGVQPGAVANFRLSANDTDPDDGLDLGSIAIVAQPAHGTVTPLVDGTVNFAHDGGPAVADQFTYTIRDLSGVASNIATVQVIIGDNVCVPGQQVFAYTGTDDVFVSPCTGTFTLEAWGAQGEGGYGGLGGYASGTVDLVVGETLTITVGGQDGFNGGGPGWAAVRRNGGGASDVRRYGSGLGDRILVAAGGGGGGQTDVGIRRGGNGGTGTCGVDYCGGGGAEGYGGPGGDGGLNGGAGNVSCHSGGAGGGGFLTGGDGSCNTCYTNTCGDDGALGQGGASDTWENGICYNQYGGTSGGGGGYMGGGGSSVGNCGTGGGGGGSSYVGTLFSPVMTGGVRVGHGEVVISW